ncbi:MAG: hypothetical protein PVI90_10260 [Desulfobacteraceae bacterium]|jgi:hypothetical protein
MQIAWKECFCDKYLEIIAIRLYNLDDQNFFLKAYQQISNQSRALHCALFKMKTIPGAWSIHLWWPISSEEPSKSSEAVCISEQLRDMGLVHHVVCTPMNESAIAGTPSGESTTKIT